MLSQLALSIFINEYRLAKIVRYCYGTYRFTLIFPLTARLIAFELLDDVLDFADDSLGRMWQSLALKITFLHLFATFLQDSIDHFLCGRQPLRLGHLNMLCSVS